MKKAGATLKNINMYIGYNNAIVISEKEVTEKSCKTPDIEDILNMWFGAL